MGLIDDLKARQGALQNLHPDATGAAYVADRLDIMTPEEAHRRRAAYRENAAAGGPREGILDILKTRQRAEAARQHTNQRLSVVPARAEVDGLHPYAASAVAGELARLDALPRPWSPGSYWDSTTFEVACNLLEFANSPWSGYSVADAERDLFARAPADDRWGPREHRQKWDSARQKVGSTGRLEPNGLMRTGQVFAVADEDSGETGKSDTTDTPDIVLPELVPLSKLLAEPDEPLLYRIDRLLPAGGRALLAAQFKAGKTTLRDNLARSIADHTPFLDHFEVEALEPGKTLVVIDNEMSRGQIRRWLADQGIARPERVRVAILRGRASSFNLLDPVTRAAWAMALREANAGIVIFDCLRPVLDALGLDESREAGRFLVAFDALLHEAAVDEAILIHHMGHLGERSRGDSRLRDWPDVEWRVVRQQPSAGEEPDPAAPRYFSAYGRDVDVPEGALHYKPDSRRLSLAGGTRRDAGARAVLPEVLKVLKDGEGPMSQNQVENALIGTGHGRKAIRDALKLGIGREQIVVQDGPNRARLHSVRPSAPECAQRTESECAGAPMKGAPHADAPQRKSAGEYAQAHPASGQCQNTRHSPRLDGGRWTCPDCQQEAAG